MTSYRELNKILFKTIDFNTNNLSLLEPFFYNELEKKEMDNIDNIDNLSFKTPMNAVVLNEGGGVTDSASSMRNSIKESNELISSERVHVPALQIELSKPEPLHCTSSSIRKGIKEDIIKEDVKKWFEPKYRDSIFWCIYTFIYGYDDYLMIGSKYGNKELEEKMKVVHFIKENPKLLKTTNHKITNINIQEIMSEFMSVQNETTFLGIIALCIFYNIHIYLVDEKKKIYLCFTTNNETASKKCILYKNTNIKGYSKYRLNHSISENDILYIEENMFRLESYNKPLKAISNYKVEDLYLISNKLGIYDETLKKPKLYDVIQEYCLWNNT